jgi:hypothetical protein
MTEKKKQKNLRLSLYQQRLLGFICRGGSAFVEYQGRDHVCAAVIFNSVVYEFTVQTFKSLTERGLLSVLSSSSVSGHWWVEIRRHHFVVTDAGRKAHEEKAKK